MVDLRGAAEPDFASTIAAVIKDECESGAAAGWRSCTGCHETSEGYETGRYPYSKMFGCYVGHGCSECGGLGVVWEYWSESDLEAMARDIEPAAPEGRQEPVAWQRYGERTGWTSVDPGYAKTLAAAGVPVRPLYTRPSEQAVSEAMVQRACDEYRRVAEYPAFSDAMRSALKAAMEGQSHG